MTVIRPQRWAIALGLGAGLVVGLLLAADETDPPPIWVAAVPVVAFLVLAVRSRVEVGPARVRIVSLAASNDVPRDLVVAVHRSGGKHRPTSLEVGTPTDGPRRIALPSLLSPSRVARTLGVPYLSWSGDREVGPAELGAPWVTVVAIALAVAAVAMAVGFTLWG